MIHFDKKQLLKAYDLLLFQKKKKKKMALIFGVVHESQSGPVLCYLQKQFSKVLVSYHFFFFPEQPAGYHPTLLVVSYGLIVAIQFQRNGNRNGVKFELN